MWLTYGVNADGALVHVDDVPRGKIALVCPYCTGALLAKKGQRVSHHFAHRGATCRPAARVGDLPILPLYDHFHLHLSGKELEALNAFKAGQLHDRRLRSRLDARGVIRWNATKHLYGGEWELTKLGQIPFGDLSLLLFCKLQEPLIDQRHLELERAAERAWRGQGRGWTIEERLTDLRIYRAQLKRILSLSLYFLVIAADGQTLYKIGVTQRDIDERLAEVRRDLVGHFRQVAITVLGVWPHRGNVELYFKHRYQAQRATIGTLTEYFQFDDITPVLRDLRRMPKRTLTPDELALAQGAPADIELTIATERAAEAQTRLAAERTAARSSAIQAGMASAKASGVHVGRPFDTDFLAKSSSQRVVAALQAGLSIRRAAAEAGVAVGTVQKVKAALEESKGEE